MTDRKSLEGFVFVTAEYNRAPTGVLKNALDYAYREFNRKPAAYVGYGGVGGARAIEQLCLINVELQMAPTRSIALSSRDPRHVNAMGEHGWHMVDAAWQRLLTAEQKARIASITEHGEHGSH